MKRINIEKHLPSLMAILFCCSVLSSCAKTLEKPDTSPAVQPASSKTFTGRGLEADYPESSQEQKDHIEELLVALANTEPHPSEAREKRQAELRSLGRSAVPVLITFLKDHSQTVVPESQRALKSFGVEAVPGLVACLNPRTDPLLSDRATETLALIGNDAVDMLLPYLNSDREDLRASAAAALMSLSARNYYLDEHVSTALASTLSKEGSAVVRKGCVCALGAYMWNRADYRTQFAKALVSDESPAVRMAAIDALAARADYTFYFSGLGFSDQVKQLPEDKQTELSNYISEEQMKPMKKLMLKSPTADLGFQFNLTDDDKKEMPYLKNLTGLERRSLSELVYEHLARTTLKGQLIETGFSASDQKSLIELLSGIFHKDQNKDVRLKAQKLLLQLLRRSESVSQVMVALLPLLEDEDSPVDEKQMLIRSVMPGADREVVFALSKAVGKSALQSEVLSALRRLGDEAKPAYDSVNSLTSDPENRDNAAITLVAIGGTSKDRAYVEQLFARGDQTGSRYALTLAFDNPRACAQYLDTIKTLLHSPDLKVRENSARALKLMGAEAEPALEDLAATAQFRADDASGRASSAALHEIQSRLNEKWNQIPSYLLEGMAVGAPITGRIVSHGHIETANYAGQTGYIDKQGNLVLPVKQKMLRPFSEGLARLSDYKFDSGSHKELFIDTEGKTVISLPGVTAESFHEGLAVVRKPDKENGMLCGYIDKAGKIAIPYRFIEARDFSEGYAAVSIPDSNKTFARVGFIASDGSMAIEPRFLTAASFSEGLSLVRDFEGRSFFIDKNGKAADIRIKQGEPVKGFSEGLAVIKLRGKFGYIDRSGQLVIPAIYDLAGRFKEGLAAVASSNEKKFGFIDRQGKTIVPFAYDWAHDFSDGLALVKKNGLFGYVDKTGAEAIQPCFVTANDFQNGLAPVGMGFVEILD